MRKQRAMDLLAVVNASLPIGYPFACGLVAWYCAGRAGYDQIHEELEQTYADDLLALEEEHEAEIERLKAEGKG